MKLTEQTLTKPKTATGWTKSHADYINAFAEASKEDTLLGAALFLEYANKITEGGHVQLDMAFTLAVRNIKTVYPAIPREQCAAIEAARVIENIP